VRGPGRGGRLGGGRGRQYRAAPLFPYPKVARDDGSGSVDDAANFTAADPPRRFDDRFDWLGEFRPLRERH
jgi:hypothetical protein